MKYEISTLISYEKETVYRISCFRISGAYFRGIFSFYKEYKTQQPSDTVEFISSGKSNPVFTTFNPNDLNAQQWEKLGFTPKQAKTILNYKEKYATEVLLPKNNYLSVLISKQNLQTQSLYTTSETAINKNPEYRKKDKNLQSEGNSIPDNYNVQDWINLGFSERQSESILKYKTYLGGSFQSKEKFKECFYH